MKTYRKIILKYRCYSEYMPITQSYVSRCLDYQYGNFDAFHEDEQESRDILSGRLNARLYEDIYVNKKIVRDKPTFNHLLHYYYLKWIYPGSTWVETYNATLQR